MRLRDRFTVAFGVLAMATAVFAVGGVLRSTQAIVGAFVALALGTQLLARRSLDRTSPLLVFLACAAGLTAVQLIPLPSGVLEALNATGTHLRADGAGLLGTDPWPSLSMDPASSLQRLAFFLILIGVATLALRVAAGERGRFRLLAAVAVVCGLAAIVAGAHALMRAETLYGIYEPQQLRGQPVLGPLLNTNHLGCLTAIGAVLSFGLAFHTRQSTHGRALWIGNGIACAVVVVASESRGAMIALAVGLAVALYVLVAGSSDSRKRLELRRELPIAIAIGVGLAIALYVQAGDIAEQLDHSHVTELDRPGTKYVAWKASMELVEESPWLGIGRGATETTFPRVHAHSGRATYAHLENEYVTAVVEWGVLGALVMGGALLWCLVTAARRRRDGPLAAAALGALSVVAFQSSVDYGIELMGVAIPVTVIAATVQLAPLREGSSGRWVRARRVLLLVGVAGSALVLLAPMSTSASEDHAALGSGIDDEEIRAIASRHPLDYVPFGIAAERAWRAGDPQAVTLLNHALRLHPTHPGLHLLAARMLVKGKRFAQAAVEYASVIRSDNAPRKLLIEIFAVMPTVEDAADAIPTDFYSTDVMVRLLEDLKRTDVAVRWLTRVARTSPNDVKVVDKLYDLAVRTGDLVTAKEAAELRRARANTTTSKLLLVRVLLKLGEHERVLTELRDVRDWTGRLDEKGDAWMIHCDALIALARWDAGLECVHRLDGSGLMGRTRGQIEKRLEAIRDGRQRETNLKAIENLQRSLGEPSRPSSPPR